MRISLDTRDKMLIVNFNGELDHHSAEEIRKEIDKIYFERRLDHIVLDLKKLNFMDSSGIGLIMGRYKNVSDNGGKLYIINASSRVEKILKMSGILKIVQMYNTLDDIPVNI
ncbi:anti-sigma F factor antagonist [Proteiniborus sp. MB09-C3]|uniref:anti-sigma F factor antagonist n=1 Tax=Proteiniborus sp. MB09-C3 TaxID=3050072 RepID=UPI0025533EDC|nr:anti-sigma F factor antagonist [Proteiniborus sp. MB09-C3]WIV10716.1 anti-sigma F factor antagonist [Proteiniborus sp. MB09-C3]